MTHWLLDLTWGGRVFRFASADVEVLDADGVSLPYVGGLVPQYEIGAPIGEIQADIEVDLGELVFPVDVALWHRQGRPLVGCAAELSTWTEGDTWEERRVRLSGRITASEYGAEGEPVALVLRWDGGQDGASVVPSGAVVSLDTQNAADELYYGTSYPMVFGIPGRGNPSVGALSTTGGSPAIVIDDTGNGTVLVAGHEVDSGAVRLVRERSGAYTGLTASPSTAQDDVGRSTAVVDGGSAGFFAVGDKVFVDWNYLSAGAAQGVDGGRVRTAADLCLWLVSRSSAEIDVSAWRGLALTEYRLDGYVDDDVSPLEFLREAVMSLLPLSAVPGPRGLVPVVWRPTATSSDARATLIDGENVERASGQRADLDAVRNRITVRYAPRADDGEPSGTVSADEDTNAVCAASRTTYPESAETIETAIVYDEATARRIASWRAAAFALPIETVTYDVLDDALDLSVGDVVALTDDGLHLSSRVAHVARVAYDGAGVSVDLVMFGLPGRDYLEE